MGRTKSCTQHTLTINLLTISIASYIAITNIFFDNCRAIATFTKFCSIIISDRCMQVQLQDVDPLIIPSLEAVVLLQESILHFSAE